MNEKPGPPRRPLVRLIPVLLVAGLALGACTRVVSPVEEGSIQFERNSAFDGETLTVFLDPERSVDTAADAVGTGPASTPIPGHRARAWNFLKVKEDGTTVAYALASWDPDDPADYLMAGWWAEFPGQKPPDLSFGDWQGYGIVDGPEIDVNVPPDLPLEGTANYAGMAGGLYRYRNEDIDVIDEWEGALVLTADFADRSVRGCIGCVGDLVTRRAHFRTFLGDEVVDRDSLAKDYELHLGTAILEDNSAFERDRVTVRHPSRTIVRSDGGWGGSLSNRPDADGNPRLAAGFAWVSFEEADASRGHVFGTFVGLSETFAKTPPPPQ